MDGEISHADGWADAPPIFFLKHQKENAPRPVEKKKCSAGRSAPAQTSCRRRGKVGCPSRQSGTETRCPWGDLWPGEVRDTSSASFRCRWPVVDESFSIGQGDKTSTPARAARSEAERAEREAGQMRPCNPTTWAPSATGRQYRPGRRPKRARRQGQIGACTGTPTPVARRATAPERANAFLFGPCTARFSFGTTKEKWGVHPAWTMPPAGAGSPPAAGRRLLHTPWRVHRPAINLAAIPRPTGRLRPSSIPKISKF